MAQAILLQDVESLGERGQAVDVSPGYLRNYLVPRKLAQPATAGALEEAQRRREAAEKAEKARAEREAAGRRAARQDRADDPPAGGRGRQAVRLRRPQGDRRRPARRPRPADREKRKVRLEQPLREVGTFMVEIELADGTVAAVKTIISEEK